MIVTPGYTFTDSETVTADKLNDLGSPTVALENGDILPEHFDLSAVTSALGDGAAAPNYFKNGNFAAPYWSRGTAAANAPVGQVTYRADWWFVRPAFVSGVTTKVLYSQEQVGPNNRSLHSARLVGATGIEIVDFGQDIPSHLAASLRGTVTVSFYLFNGTGAALTPSVRFETADSVGNFNSTTGRGTVTAPTSAGNATWVRFTLTADISSYANITNGLRVLIRFPATALNSSAKYIRISQAKIERGTTATAFVAERDEQSEDADLSTDAVPRNFLANPQFAHNRWLQPGIAAVENVDTYAVERWFVRAGGASGALINRINLGAAVGTAFTSMKITGATGTSDVDIGQNLEVQVASAVAQDVVFSAYIYNDTGAAFTPSIRIDTCDSDNNFSTVTNRVDQALQVCEYNDWTRVTYSFTGATLTNFRKGARIMVRIPNGSLNASTKHVGISNTQLEVGTAATAWETNVETERPSSALTAAKQLVITKTSAQVVTAVAVDVTLRATDGQTMNTGTFSETATATTGGAGGLDTGSIASGNWYYLWAISDGEAIALLISLSSTSPTMPSGFRFKGLIGVARYVSGAWRDFRQNGHCGIQVPVAVIDAIAADLDRNQVGSVAAATAIPPNAVKIGGTLGATNNVDVGVILTGGDSTLGSVLFNATTGLPNFSGYRAAAPYELTLNDFQTLWWASANTTAHVLVSVTSYELHI